MSVPQLLQNRSQNSDLYDLTEDSQFRGPPTRPSYPMLSIDGGGIRGIIPARVLTEIETRTGKPISSLFQLVGGTSTGGILTLGLTKPGDGEGPQYSAQDLYNLYTQRHTDIFRPNPDYQPDTRHLPLGERLKRAIRNPKYITPDLFAEKFNDCCLSSALTDVVITANTTEAIASKVTSLSLSGVTAVVSFMAGLFGYDPTPILSHDSIARKVHLFTKRGLHKLSYSLDELENLDTLTRRYSVVTPPGEPVRLYSIRREKKADFYMKYVAQVTSAAPGYFPPVKYSRNEWLVDGGVLQNDPAIPCVLDALDKGVPNEDLFMLSLGTGVEAQRRPGAGPRPSLTSLWFDTTQPHDRENEVVRDMLPLGAHFRFQYHFDNRAPDLDSTDDHTIQTLKHAGDTLVEDKDDEIRDICRLLDPDSV